MNFKTLTIAFLFLIYGRHAQAQIPNYFENGQAWITHNYTGPDLTEDGLAHYRVNRFYVSHDTLVGAYTYQIIRKFERFTTSAMEGPEDYSTSLATAIIVRQEERKIYFLFEGTDSLFIAYDLEVGENLNGYFGALNPGKTIHTIDSVLVGDTYRRIFFTDTDEDPFPNSQLIEGIGHIDGVESGYFFSNTNYGEYWSLSIFNEFNCYGEEHVQLWPNVGVACAPSLTLGISEAQEARPIQIYPNPTRNLITISSETPLKSVKIQTIDGAVVNETSVNTTMTQLDLTALNTGIYIVYITLESGDLIRKKLIKQ